MNLIVCISPLQMLIASKIVELYPSEDFYFLAMPPDKSTKYMYYIDILEKKCKKSKMIITDSNRNKYRLIINAMILKFLPHKFDKIFISNIDNYLVQLIISDNPSSSIFTFDDGTANIVKSGYFYDMVVDGPKMRLSKSLFGIKDNIETIKKKSIAHYTIYPNISNIIKNTIPINLFKNSNQVMELKNEHVTILLGQTIFDDNENNILLVKKAISKFSIDFYFPHPREKLRIDNINYIDTHLIFEDYFIKNLSNKQVTLLTFFSSAALNLIGAKNVKIIFLYDKMITEKKFVAIYNFIKSINMKVVDL